MYSFCLPTPLLMAASLAVASAWPLAARAQAPAPSPAQTVQQIDYTVLACRGNPKTHEVTLTLLLTNKGPARALQFEQARAIGLAGDEFKTYRIAIGSSGIRATLPTDVPLKATILLPKVPAATMQFALVECSVFNGSEPGRTLNVTFRGVPVSWR